MCKYRLFKRKRLQYKYDVTAYVKFGGIELCHY